MTALAANPRKRDEQGSAEKLYSAATRLQGFVQVVTLFSVVGTIVSAVAATSDTRYIVVWIGAFTTVSFWVFGSLISRAGRAYATDLMRRTA